MELRMLLANQLLMRRVGLPVLCMLACLMAACHQPQGSSLPATDTANLLATFTMPPSSTPDVLVQIVTSTPEPIALIAYTNTPDPRLFAPTEVAFAAQVVTDPLLQTATALAVLANQAQNMPTLAPPMVSDPLLQTATAMAFSAQGNVAQGDIAALEIDPLFMTATAFIVNATGTAGAPMTQTMDAILGPSPTPTLDPMFATPTPNVPIGTCQHTVVAGENLFRISLRYNTTVAALAAANGIVNPALIIVGQTLNIPGCGGVAPTPDPGIGGGGTSGNWSCTGQNYNVQQGESLFEISLRFNVPVDALVQCNNISNPGMIFIDQPLVIPTRIG